MPTEISRLGQLDPLPPTEAALVQEQCAIRYHEDDFPLLDVDNPIKIRIERANSNSVWLCGFDAVGTEIAYLVGCLSGPDHPETKMADLIAAPTPTSSVSTAT